MTELLDAPAGLPRLPAATPADWFTIHLDPFLRSHAAEGFEESARRWFDVPGLLAGDGAALREMFTRYRDEGATPQAAAKWVVGGLAVRIAAVHGFLYALGGAAVLPGGSPRVGLHPDGWAELVDLADPLLAVPPGHPWACLTGVTTVAPADLPGIVATAVRQVTEPVVAAGRVLARLGARTLWAEIADALATWAGHHATLPVDAEVLRDLELVLDAPGAPWRKRPDLWLVEHHGVPTPVARKAGCCLAYQCEPVEPEIAAEVEPAGFMAAWRAAFPQVEGKPEYCSTCSLRDRDDCAARLLFERGYDLRAER